MAEGDVERHEVRVTVPLFDTSVSRRDGSLGQGRIEIANEVVLAELDDAESERVAGSLVTDDRPDWRLEIHGVAADVDLVDHWHLDLGVVSLVRKHFALLACAVRMAPRWESIALDLFDGRIWRRVGVIVVGGGAQRGHSYLPISRLETWGQLIGNWPDQADTRTMTIVLDNYLDSIAERLDHQPGRSLLNGAICVEVLLGPGVRQELRYRLSQRGALLGAPPPATVDTFRALRDFYDARSALVHNGTEPEENLVVQLHQILMRLIPSMGRLMELEGGHAAAAEALDAAALGHRDRIAPLFVEKGWWGHVNLEDVLNHG